MPKKIIIKQFDLPFDADIVLEVWEQFEPKVKTWHKFQKTSKSAGNCFFWWRSRYSEFIEEIHSKWTVDERIKRGKLFPRIWETYGKEMSGVEIVGVPKEAYE